MYPNKKTLRIIDNERVISNKLYIRVFVCER